MNLGTTSNGFIGKLIEYKGKAAHAAAAPHEGINALQAAMMGVMGVNAIRDTFKESDYIRFHPIINSGGDLVAQQVLGALCLNKGLILPPRFLLAQTANDPGSALADPEMLMRLDGYAANMLRTMSPDAPKN